MKKILLSIVFIMFSPVVFAGTNWSINLGLGMPYPFYQPAPIYHAQPPIIVYPQPGYYNTPQSYYAPPAYYSQPPVVIYNHPHSRNYGRGYYRHEGHEHRR